MTEEASARRKLSTLIAQRDILEIEADALHSELLSINALPGVSLVDGEGFPRSDVDIVRVLEKRQRIAIINTDHKALMKEIERTLRDVHEEASLTHGPVTPAARKDQAIDTPMPLLTGLANLCQGFAVVDEVADSSPACVGGLLIGDIVLQFGPVSGNISSSDSPLSLIPGIVQKNIDKPIMILIRRGDLSVELFITPSVWSGRGLLGCHLKPL